MSHFNMDIDPDQQVWRDFQQECEAYALFGDPEQDHWDHEAGAGYRNPDEMRDWCGEQADMEPGPEGPPTKEEWDALQWLPPMDIDEDVPF